MRKLIIILTFVISVIASNNLLAQNATISSTGEVERNGNTFIASSKSNKNNAQQTQYTWKDSKGVEYPIYISASGSCYVIKTSKKTGKEYKNYLPKEVSTEICKELNYKRNESNKRR